MAEIGQYAKLSLESDLVGKSSLMSQESGKQEGLLTCIS